MIEYFKVVRGTRHIEVIEMTENSWLSLTKKSNKVGDPLFEIYKIPHNSDDYDDGVWWKCPNNKCTKEEFEQLKFEFLNWIEQNLSR